MWVVVEVKGEGSLGITIRGVAAAAAAVHKAAYTETGQYQVRKNVLPISLVLSYPLGPRRPREPETCTDVVIYDTTVATGTPQAWKRGPR
jgi:hypothetical protein